ncbi:MAG: DUF2157 domain-containing protein [Lactobacillaceae bacterium]|jgi:uncharacterized membrane protein|nr:DUF2157 domain-containing protein [Lactobacillaceae bacterium]
MNLLKKIDLWQNEGIISSDQASAIRTFEAKDKKPTLIYMLLFLSVFCIGVGIVSLIASNWKMIPAGVKLTIDFAILISAALGIYWSEINKKNFIKESLIILFAILVIATIGLVAQIYHLKSNGYSAALFWSIMIAPLFFITRKSILPFVWLFVFNYAFFAWMFANFPALREIVSAVASRNDMIITGYYLSLLALFGCFMLGKYKDKVSYLIKPVFVWLIISIIIQSVFMEFKYNWYKSLQYYDGGISYSSAALLIIGLFSLAVVSAYLYRKEAAAYIFYSIMVLMLFSLFIDAAGYSKLVKAASTFSMLALLMAYAHKNNAAKLFNFAGALAAVRIFIIYLQVFGSLLTTGVGLIISGLILLGIIIVWHKISIRVKSKFKEKTNEA